MEVPAKRWVKIRFHHEILSKGEWVKHLNFTKYVEVSKPIYDQWRIKIQQTTSYANSCKSHTSNNNAFTSPNARKLGGSIGPCRVGDIPRNAAVILFIEMARHGLTIQHVAANHHHQHHAKVHICWNIHSISKMQSFFAKRLIVKWLNIQSDVFLKQNAVCPNFMMEMALFATDTSTKAKNIARYWMHFDYTI